MEEKGRLSLSFEARGGQVLRHLQNELTGIHNTQSKLTHTFEKLSEKLHTESTSTIERLVESVVACMQEGIEKCGGAGERVSEWSEVKDALLARIREECSGNVVGVGGGGQRM